MLRIDDPELFDWIAMNFAHHSRSDEWWRESDGHLMLDRTRLRADLTVQGGTALGSLGFIEFSYQEMGAISSLDLFGLDELIIFAFYWANRSRYANAADMGANIGLHSVVLGRMGMSVVAYEPDPRHVQILDKHLALNGLRSRVSIRQAAVASAGGTVEFVRLLGNTTGSHVAGAKTNPYGHMDRFEVHAIPVIEATSNVDLVKMDVEGLEADLLQSLPLDAFEGMDLICEIGSALNASMVWERFRSSPVHLFSQKTGWSQVSDIAQMPTSYREGSLFISRLEAMPWGSR